MSDEAIINIGIAMAKPAAEVYEKLEDRLKAAMKEMKDFWLTGNDEIRFKAAVGAVFLLSNEEDKLRLKEEMDTLRTLSAIFSGIQVDLGSIKTPENPIGLIKMWNEIKEGK